MDIAIIGAGNGGQAMAAHFTMLGHKIRLYNRSLEKILPIIETGCITLYDKIVGTSVIHQVTDNIREAIEGVDLIMITTTANAHSEIACKIADIIQEDQTIVLNPGRTLGALEFSKEIKKKSNVKTHIAEAQSLIYACRAESPGKVRIIGVKDKVLVSAYPLTDTGLVLSKLNKIFPCFIKAENILHTSLENIGAILHPAVILFNAAAIERGSMFYFYSDMTPAVADFLEKLDNERLMIGRAFGVNLLSLFDWISYAYNNIKGNTLLEKIRNNPAYYKISAPDTLYSRLLLEDIPTGILPMTQLARMVNIETPLMNSVLEISQALLGKNYINGGRTLNNLGLYNVTKEEFIHSL
jgi:opine dehydrogenase